MALRTTLPSRESTFPYPLPTDFLAHLEDCVSHTESCSATLSAGLDKLAPGTSDLPRLTKVLGNKHHFLLLPYPTILTHKSALSTSLAPQIDTLVNRAEALLSSESLRVKNLEDRLNILHSARLPHIEPVRPAHPRTFAREAREADGAGEEAAGGSRLDGLEVKDLNPAQRRKVAMLRGKRERLEKERRALQGAE
ncbi:hypothetical protein JCM24511_08317 [Saitozyma sp. JCM 24511]|nr:hypothetical protein JCM24511_08317 [Saitozyma sp. JCM 24511]